MLASHLLVSTKRLGTCRAATELEKLNHCSAETRFANEGSFVREAGAGPRLRQIIGSGARGYPSGFWIAPSSVTACGPQYLLDHEGGDPITNRMEVAEEKLPIKSTPKCPEPSGTRAAAKKGRKWKVA